MVTGCWLVTLLMVQKQSSRWQHAIDAVQSTATTTYALFWLYVEFCGCCVLSPSPDFLPVAERERMVLDMINKYLC